MVKLDIRGQPTGLSLYEVWEAFVALTSTCVGGMQKCGKASDLGLYNYSKVRLEGSNVSRSWPQYIPSIVRRAPRHDDTVILNWESEFLSFDQ